MLISDLDHDHLDAILRSVMEGALEKAIPKALLAHERQKYIRMGMTVDVAFYSQGISSKWAMIQCLSSLPECPPLPAVGKHYSFRADPDSAPEHFTVERIVHSYKYLTYESSPDIPELITDISVYLSRR